MPVLKAKTQQSQKTSTKETSKKRKTINKKKGEAVVKRAIVHKEVSVILHLDDSPAGSLTEKHAKKLLGWKEEQEKEPFGKRFFFVHQDKKVRLDNNTDNRFFQHSWAKVLMQEILRGRWKFNAEPIIVGKTGQICDGQHTLVALIWAVQEWRDHAEKWPHWKSEPTIEKLVVYGVSEADAVVNTINTGKVRTDADVIGRMPYFRDFKTDRDRRLCAKAAANCVKMLWHRTGEKANPFSLARTHAETVAYIDLHSRIVDAVRHVYEEDDGTGKLGKLISIGYAAACMYLMATSDSDPEKYYLADTPNEDLLDFSQWDKASEFFVELAGSAKPLKPVQQAILNLMAEETRVTPAERVAIIAKAWEDYVENGKIDPEHLELEYDVKDEMKVLTEHPLFGGIDVGDELPFPTNGEKEEIEKRKDKVKAKKFPVKQQASRKGDDWAEGDTAWVHNTSDSGDAYFATLLEDPWEDATGAICVQVEDHEENQQWEVKIENLSLKQFERVT